MNYSDFLYFMSHLPHRGQKDYKSSACICSFQRRCFREIHAAFAVLCSYWNKLWPVLPLPQVLCAIQSWLLDWHLPKANSKILLYKNNCKSRPGIISVFWNIGFSTLISNFNVSFISVLCVKKTEECMWKFYDNSIQKSLLISCSFYLLVKLIL